MGDDGCETTPTNVCAPNVELAGAPPYTWAAAADTKLDPFEGLLHSYDGSGYVIELPLESGDEAAAVIERLVMGGFLDEHTRAVWVDLSTYKPYTPPTPPLHPPLPA